LRNIQPFNGFAPMQDIERLLNKMFPKNSALVLILLHARKLDGRFYLSGGSWSVLWPGSTIPAVFPKTMKCLSVLHKLFAPLLPSALYSSGFSLLVQLLILQLAESRAYVDFSQGLDIRLTTPDNIALLNRVRTKAVHFAWDDPNVDLTGYFRRFVERTAIKSDRRRRVYVLTNYGSTHEQDLYRVDTLRGLGFDPYVMVYDRPSAPPITRQLARWVNNKRIFRVVPNFADYIPNPNKKSARP